MRFKEKLRFKIEFINKNNLAYAEGNVIKYVCRHKYKGKLEDIKKAIHYLEIIIERDYEKKKYSK
jgi:hypothetical protein